MSTYQLLSISKGLVAMNNTCKIDLVAFSTVLGQCGKQSKVFAYILSNMNSDNIYVGSLKGIAERVGVSLDTVDNTMKMLKSFGFLSRVQNGLYQVSPRVIIRGENCDTANN